MKKLLVILLLLPGPAAADEALIAVATNFHPLLERLRDDFQATSSHAIKLSSGSTGVLYAQIINGAPYDLFFAADQSRPQLLEQDGHGVPGSRFTYAEGRLAYWQNDAKFAADGFLQALQQADIRVLAIANPALAPYGIAAREAIRSAGQWDLLEPKLVLGENVGQAFSMVATGNADAGIVALSTVLLAPDWVHGNYLEVPRELYPPIRQDAVVLRRGMANPAVHAFLVFLQRDASRARIAAAGYW